jgi:hypothetical protein
MSQIVPLYVNISEHPKQCSTGTENRCYHVDCVSDRKFFILKEIPASLRRKIIALKRLFSGFFVLCSLVSM